jgi:acyl dehydratase
MSFTAMHLYAEDIEAGQEWDSLGRTITEADVVNFAGLSGDFNPIHLDHEFARGTPFHRPIAHGLLVLSVASGLALYYPPMRTLAFVGMRDWQFRGPVFIGDTLRVHTKLVEKEVRARGRRAVLTWYRQVINQDGKVVQEGVTQTIVEGRGILAPKAEGAAGADVPS